MISRVPGAAAGTTAGRDAAGGTSAAMLAKKNPRLCATGNRRNRGFNLELPRIG
jgi:hypothetical protein